jgi:hypothetical protein
VRASLSRGVEAQAGSRGAGLRRMHVCVARSAYTYSNLAPSPPTDTGGGGGIAVEASMLIA